MSIPAAFRIDSTDRLYYNTNDLFEYHSDFFIGCKDKKRKIIERKNIPSTDYVYANFVKKTDEWNITGEHSKKAALLISKVWVDQFFFPAIKKGEKMAESKEVSVMEPIAEPLVEPEEEESDVLECLPEILHLEDGEKFKDSNGTIMNIEVRGERDRTKVYFNVSDVSEAFGIPYLKYTILKKDRGYERGLHYKTFITVVIDHRNINADPNKPIHNTNKALYLTYKGLMRVLYNTRGKNAEHFTDWADDKLFTIQMGSTQQKEELGTSILGIKLENYRAVFTKYSQSFPCIYLLSLGSVKSLRNTFQLSDEMDDKKTVYKYGFTNDMKRRLGEHQRDYGKLVNVEIELELFNYIDVKYTSEAEGDIRDLFDGFGKSLQVEGRNELVVLNSREFQRVKKEYTRTGREYAGATQVLQEEISRLKTELVEVRLSHKIELQAERNEKDKYKTLVETNERIHQLEKQNYELQIKMNQCGRT
jgi:hypothetical protein